jgi:hypothetical protein
MKGGTLAMLDGRKRVNLAQVATTDTYLMFVEKSGRIILEPAVVMTEEERAILEDSAVRPRLGGAVAEAGGRAPPEATPQVSLH